MGKVIIDFSVVTTVGLDLATPWCTSDLNSHSDILRGDS